MDEVEKEVERFRFAKSKPVYEKRRDLLVHIPSFWYIVLAEHEDFQEYVQTDDMKYLEFIREIYVEYLLDDDPLKFSITFGFEAPKGEIETQTVTKRFEKIHDVETGEEKLVSEAVDVKWPAELDSVNPHLIKAKGEMTPADKKKYRAGMKSFFAFFAWTGRKPGKEYRHGEDLALLIRGAGPRRRAGP
ncbi:hypothetical protein KL930_002316 [Ogataea haglerorum]|uniref:Uncharacterized protein n=1 Tax=Ogataea haglerorum TaxID=1937702 RepID=A0AAN6D7L0_9ASCO|nr:uncharacterized protein KL911_000078 [Ogataea haglerorum]KAG7698896.1 hypothetical protein KL915_001188 [Ogataea haglerorum]KAG7700500.1 hypothetical protein KL951_000615 [Ogataea haglerorum]KAG7709938.1 hypothetical protein KL914_000848 [Ogataea haglerorum]KAG7711281.1 hypothetical protein KL950_001247 [Ogataea haglerorum]KAG7720578.1 hypothetical protein KL913_001478 [Ogataea haglerorum]